MLLYVYKFTKICACLFYVFVCVTLLDKICFYFQKGKTAYRTNKIFVGGLPNIVNEETIRECFSRFGKVC